MSIKEIIENIRYFLIKLLARDMPVVLNMTINRPLNYTGMLAYFPDMGKPGLFSTNRLYGNSSKVYTENTILIPSRDVGKETKKIFDRCLCPENKTGCPIHGMLA